MGLRTNTSRISSACRTRAANAPSLPQWIATKFAAEASGDRPFSTAIAAIRSTCGGNLGDGVCQILLIEKRGEGAKLTDAIDAVVIADLVERFDHASLADRVADTCAGEPVGFRKCTIADDLRV